MPFLIALFIIFALVCILVLIEFMRLLAFGLVMLALLALLG